MGVSVKYIYCRQAWCFEQVPLVLCGCKTWSLALREEHRPRVFENRMLRRIFGLKRDEIIRGWRKLHACSIHEGEEECV
jgi:hypothetical protein